MNRSTFLTLAAAALAAFLPASAAEPAPKDLPKVLIIGDSISIGYTPYVKRQLKDEVSLSHNPGNAANTGTGLAKIDAWLGDTRWDLIHFNWGLHDLCYRNPDAKQQGNRDKVKGTITTTPEQYEKNLDQLVTRLAKTGATLVWASTTLVPEGEAGRIAGDDKKYNQVAARVMKKHGVVINDLHALSATFGPELFARAGDVHYKAAGYQKLGTQVAESIRTTLKTRKPN
ncbi:MAG: SGNH/GDSL hydrolase family protein [Verrucomicrobiia bacterium Tous-C4TDCM]|nr:MAG: SGNH/GDSL hydrolase family protein [Verrucomicrobiae bacterium Tous-C4TDCM]